MEAMHRDRRVSRTWRALHEALRSLCLRKGYDRITVLDVMDQADVGRATFYAHFQDIDDLLISVVGEMRNFLRPHLAALVRAQESRSGIVHGLGRALFEHAASHRQEYSALARSSRGGAVLRLVHNEITSLIQECLDETATRRRLTPPVPTALAARYAAGAFLSLLMWWLGVR